ncbi:phenol 2-monooxygenase [Sphingomonas sp. BE270]|jgi:2-polyprenyl-6-methoxyphenol hydroxylase-like FAD-dependent oxidoreductase|nr:FAD-dependent monooxygenase [Sphingomonas sp. BE270]MDR7260032.1 phenol 2-monooxygenase [Sphingomonas sp. BE270]
MQFNLNGFRTGDPDAHAASEQGVRRSSQVELPSQVDVLVVGCGPAGLTLAAQLAAFPEIDTCIVDANPGPLELGRADGIACRSMEMFQAFGFAEKVMRESYWVNETTFWRTQDEPGKGIVRTGRIDDVEPGLSEFPHTILNQARVHEFYLDIMRRSPNRIVPHYGRTLVDLAVDPASSHPVTARFEVVGADGSRQIEVVTARYAVGCDGARSTVRRSLGIPLEGDSANQAWGVMDILAVTDFPDIRLKSVITSADGGTIVLIPREGGYLARIYVEMDKLGKDERVTQRSIAIEDVIAAANRVFHPYVLDVKEIAWWSVYEIGQRMSPRFDDVSEGAAAAQLPHAFIAGDACHTHSPKAGQGMNVSMQDTFNLGWKLAAVLRGISPPELLRSYSDERRDLAKTLIDFDREWAALLSAASKPENAIDPAKVQAYFVEHGHYTAGTATRYKPSVLIGSAEHQHLATGYVVGKRFHSAPVIRLADARPMQLGHVVEADGRWRLFVFAPGGNQEASLAAVGQLCRFLTDTPQSPIVRFARPGADIDALIDVRCVLPFHHRGIEPGSLPDLLLPRKGRLELQDYEKAFCIDPQPDRDIYAMRGIDQERGCLIVVRPDQYVAQVLPFDGVAALTAFFDPIFTRP